MLECKNPFCISAFPFSPAEHNLLLNLSKVTALYGVGVGRERKGSELRALLGKYVNQKV